jgi:hypothetical protein
MKTCVVQIMIPGTAKPGTAPTVYDPCNTLGGQQYKDCGLPATHTGKVGELLCNVHAFNYPEPETVKLIDDIQ